MEKSKCPKCEKEFDSEQALRMHHIRVHTKAGREGAKLGSRKGGFASTERAKKRVDVDQVIREAALARKREYNTKIRKAYQSQGLTTAGKPRKRGPYQGHNRVMADELGNNCPLCTNVYKTRASLGAHVRQVHNKSLFDLPPYSNVSRDTFQPEVQPEVKPEAPSGTAVFIDDGTTTVTIKTRFSLKELVNYILET